MLSIRWVLAATLVSAFALHGQIPLPRRTPKKEVDFTVVKGVLRRVTDSQMLVETDDKRMSKLNTTAKTKYLQREEPIKAADIELGDRVMVDASEDSRGNLTAVEVRLTKRGTAEDHARAKQSVPRDDDDEPAAASPTSPAKSDRATGSTSAKREELTDFDTLKGVLRRMTDSEMLVETDDRRMLKVSRTDRTRFLIREDPIKASEIEPGDKVMIDAGRDSKGKWVASQVRLTKRGTPEEHARAKANPPRDDDDDDAPAQPAPAAKAESRRLSEPAPRNAEPDERAPTAMAPPDARDTMERPKLSRGRPAATASSRRPSSDDDEPAPVTSNPAPAPARRLPAGPLTPEQEREERLRLEEEGGASLSRDRAPSVEAPPPGSRDSFIEKARDMAVNFSETLPSYIVKQFTTRFQSDNPRVNWQPVDNVSADVVYEGGKESYKNILVNGKPPKGKVEDSGSWSKGEFASVLQDVFSPATAADFTPTGNATVATRSARVYKFVVEQPNSHWKISAPGESYFPAYKGTIWIDKETARVLRIEMQARNMPKAFPIDTVEMNLDYEFVRLSGMNAYLLPVHSENLACFRGTSSCSKNVIDFRNYRKYGAESTIIFK